MTTRKRLDKLVAAFSWYTHLTSQLHSNQASGYEAGVKTHNKQLDVQAEVVLAALKEFLS